jgi:di/tricarboxylate transporter
MRKLLISVLTLTLMSSQLMSATAAPIYVFPIVGCKATYARAHHDYQATDIQAKAGCKYVAPTGGTITEVSAK